MIWGLVKVGVGEGVGDMEEAMAAGVLLAGDPDEVINPEVEEACVLLILIVFDQFEFVAVVIVGFGATRTMLGIELCTIKVAVIVA